MCPAGSVVRLRVSLRGVNTVLLKEHSFERCSSASILDHDLVVCALSRMHSLCLLRRNLLVQAGRLPICRRRHRSFLPCSFHDIFLRGISFCPVSLGDASLGVDGDISGAKAWCCQSSTAGHHVVVVDTADVVRSLRLVGDQLDALAFVADPDDAVRRHFATDSKHDVVLVLVGQLLVHMATRAA